MAFREKKVDKRALRKYRNTHEKKSADIKRSLVRRARIRKKYFKMLEQEGEEVPAKVERSEPDESNDEEGNASEKNDEEGKEDFEDEEEDFFEEPVKPKAKQEVRKPQKKKAYTHEQRIQLIKERKLAKRKEYEENLRTRELQKKHSEAMRKRHAEQINQFTRKGQPKMGPRISRLLDQIKEMKNQ